MKAKLRKNIVADIDTQKNPWAQKYHVFVIETLIVRRGFSTELPVKIVMDPDSIGSVDSDLASVNQNSEKLCL